MAHYLSGGFHLLEMKPLHFLMAVSFVMERIKMGLGMDMAFLRNGMRMENSNFIIRESGKTTNGMGMGNLSLSSKHMRGTGKGIYGMEMVKQNI